MLPLSLPSSRQICYYILTVEGFDEFLYIQHGDPRTDKILKLALDIFLNYFDPYGEFKYAGVDFYSLCTYIANDVALYYKDDPISKKEHGDDVEVLIIAFFTSCCGYGDRPPRDSDRHYLNCLIYYYHKWCGSITIKEHYYDSLKEELILFIE